VLMWNERDESDPLMAGYGNALRRATDTSVEVMRLAAGRPLLASDLFVDADRRDFPNSQTVDENGLLERVFSASYAPRQRPRAEMLEAELRELFATFQEGGQVTLRYRTSVYSARKPLA